ncbi:MAG: hypothetical protein ACRC0I_06735 [Sediminibacterium sp.]
MVDIKPDEISAILRQQLSNFNTSAELEEVGTVLQVGDGIARVYGLNGVRSGELVVFENGVKAIAPLSANVFITPATVDAFCPTAT